MVYSKYKINNPNMFCEGDFIAKRILPKDNDLFQFCLVFYGLLLKYGSQEGSISQHPHNKQLISLCCTKIIIGAVEILLRSAICLLLASARELWQEEYQRRVAIPTQCRWLRVRLQ